MPANPRPLDVRRDAEVRRADGLRRDVARERLRDVLERDAARVDRLVDFVVLRLVRKDRDFVVRERLELERPFLDR
ncbi:MAG TPA: hypothetical protein VM674_02640 [Candidatus Acidoferrum sp.]|nr:hypothetical protein [Candidatus Acidoferrum sp.]